MAKAKGAAAKPPSPIPLHLFGPRQQALFDSLVAAAKTSAEPPVASPPKARAAVKSRPSKKSDGQEDMNVDKPVEDVAKPPRASARKPAKPRAPKKKEPSEETTASDDSKAEAKRMKKKVVKEVLKKKSGSKVSNVFYRAVANEAGDLTGQDVKKLLLAIQKVVISGLKDNGKSRISSFLSFKTKAVKERPPKDKNMFGRMITLQPRPAKKVPRNKRHGNIHDSKAKQNALLYTPQVIVIVPNRRFISQLDL